ncbi:MAG: porin family protein [Alphaproteobacteria bacterium]|nr:porin family protein [Alphaproteobacteria bacterium]
MKRTLLLATIASTVLAFGAEAADFNPYFSAKGAFVRMQNKAKVDSDYSYSGVTHYYNQLSNKKHKDNVFGLRLATGVDAPLNYGNLRSEIEFGYNGKAKDSNKFDFVIHNPYEHKYSLETSVWSAMVNFYYDFNTNTNFMPYVGAGLGYAHISAKSNVYGTVLTNTLDLTEKVSKGSFAWNVGVGASYGLTQNIFLDAGYRYTNYGRVKGSKTTDIIGLGKPLHTKGKFKVDSHEALVGLRFVF